MAPKTAEGPDSKLSNKNKDIVPEDGRKVWHRPALRRLPIAATAGAEKTNEGVGKGKGQSGPALVS